MNSDHFLLYLASCLLLFIMGTMEYRNPKGFTANHPAAGFVGIFGFVISGFVWYNYLGLTNWWMCVGLMVCLMVSHALGWALRRQNPWFIKSPVATQEPHKCTCGGCKA